MRVLGIQNFGFDMSSPRTDVDTFLASVKRTMDLNDQDLADIFGVYTDPETLAKDMRDPGHFGMRLGPLAAKALAKRLIQRFAR